MSTTATEPPRFVEGSTMRHVVVMAGTGAIGLIAVFAVDLLNLFYLSLLGEKSLAAAIGFAGAVGFVQVSVAIGMTIGIGAVVSREIGAARLDQARRIATAGLVCMVLATAVLGAGTVALLSPVLDGLGAKGETRDFAAQFLLIVSPSLPLLAGGMGCAALLRSVGDARHAMNVTLFAALATAVLDPLMIFGLHLGLAGAAVSNVLSRAVLALVGWHGVTRKHQLLELRMTGAFARDVRKVLAVAGPAILTNLATPVAAAYVTRRMAEFGPAAVAGEATIDRITPVAFGLVYALSGAVGPILAQNRGAARFDRVREALRDSLLFVVVTVAVAWLILAATQRFIIVAFSADGVTADLVGLFCTWLAGSFLFTGALFVANAAFNNLGHPLLATLFNWGRATLGTIPFVTWGARHGPTGILVGQAAGSLIFGLVAIAAAFRTIGRMARTVGARPRARRRDPGKFRQRRPRRRHLAPFPAGPSVRVRAQAGMSGDTASANHHRLPRSGPLPRIKPLPHQLLDAAGELAARAAGEHGAGAQHRHVIGDVERALDVLIDQQDRLAGARQLGDQAIDAGGDARFDARRRLVDQEHRGIVQERTRDLQLPLLAAGKRAGVPAAASRREPGSAHTRPRSPPAPAPAGDESSRRRAADSPRR